MDRIVLWFLALYILWPISLLMVQWHTQRLMRREYEARERENGQHLGEQ